MTQQFCVFCPWWPWPLTLIFELGRDFCTLYVTAKFHRRTFSRSEVIVRKDKQTDKRIDKLANTHTHRWKHTTTSLRYATPVGNNLTSGQSSTADKPHAAAHGRWWVIPENSSTTRIAFSSRLELRCVRPSVRPYVHKKFFRFPSNLVCG